MLCWGWTVKVSQLIKCLFCGSCVVSSSFRSWGPNLHKHFEKKPVWITDVRIIHCRCKKCITLMKLPGIMNFRLHILKYRNLLEYPVEQVRSPSTHVPQVTHCEQLHRKRQIKKTTYMSSVRRNTAPHNLIIE